jgi:phosphatidylethanolamine-binding protein (PEBP) family uncharacterized protein
MTQQHIMDAAFAAAAAFVITVLVSVAPAQGEARMELSSSSIVGGQIQQPHACRAKGGMDQPVQLTIRDLPADAKFISIVADDPDAVRPAGKVWVHWNVFNLPAQGAVTIAAGQKLSGDR